MASCNPFRAPAAMSAQSPSPPPSPAPAELINAASLASGTLASRMLGFCRDLMFAYLLGPAADAFLLAFRIPNFFRRLLSEGSLGLSYGAQAAAVLTGQGLAAAGVFARSAAFRLFAYTLPFTALLAFAAYPLLACMAPGLDAEMLGRSEGLLRLCLPYLPLAMFSAIGFAHAAVLGNFRPQAWGPALWNMLILLSGACVFSLLHLGDMALSGSLSVIEYGLCAGVLAGGLAQAGLALRCLYLPQGAKGTREPGGAGAKGAEARPAFAFFRRFPLAVIGAAPHQLHILAGTILVSFLPAGSISSLYFAERLVELPLGLAGAAIGFAVLPRLSALASAGERPVFSKILGESIRRTAYFSFPASAGLFALAHPLAQALFGHGAFDADSVEVTAMALQGYSLAIPALCAGRPLLSAALALGLRALPLRCAFISLLPVLLAGPASSFVGEVPGAGVLAVAVGLTAGAWTNAALLLARISRCPGISPLRGQMAPVTSYAAASLGLAGLLIAYRLIGEGPGSLMTLALAFAGAVCWQLGFSLAGNGDARALNALAARWFGGK